MIKHLSLVLLALTSSLAADLIHTGESKKRDLKFEVPGTFENRGSLIGKKSLILECDTLTGDGLLKAPQIMIRAKTFDFTGTIECSEQCRIFTKEPFDQNMFTHKEGGQIYFFQEK